MTKIKNFLFFLMLGLAFVACNNDAATDSPERAPSTPGGETVTAPQTAAPSVNPGVEHYICPNGHVGSGAAAAGNCTQCDAVLEHNQAYHNNTSTTTPPPTITPGAPTGQTTTTVTPPSTPEPPQNAAGVWHYTCASGCAGGAGSAVPCASCGTALTHNTAYHN